MGPTVTYPSTTTTTTTIKATTTTTTTTTITTTSDADDDTIGDINQLNQSKVIFLRDRNVRT